MAEDLSGGEIVRSRDFDIGVVDHNWSLEALTIVMHYGAT
jgi:hypothetical protein